MLINSVEQFYAVTLFVRHVVLLKVPTIWASTKSNRFTYLSNSCKVNLTTHILFAKTANNRGRCIHFHAKKKRCKWVFWQRHNAAARLFYNTNLNCAISMQKTFPGLFRNKVILLSGSFTTVQGSVTRLGDLLDFGQAFKAFGNN